ncbi:hypothetical protein A4X06_0g1338 [Tilletia controversa]|uniref:Uncharacterized protein n=1 Tax=Tilletia controversa TaxID=13291 RepID=A0A8X7MYM5_9BASI|nr:hypothetical protein CF328_g3267 [Tilletia controversa]KAE8253585.1 hypothetical protein A4X06_0g1338 [Tilletia controversa]
MAVTRRKSAAALPQPDALTPTPAPSKSIPAATTTATANGHALKTVKHSKNKSHIHWHSLADTHITAHQHPLFTPDGQYYFQPTAHAVRILSRHTGATISTLTPPPLPHALSDDTINPASHSITALALHPANPLQLLSASTNGSICVWDYLDAALLRIFFLPIPSSSTSAEGERATTKSSEDAAVPGMPITHLVASEHYPDWAFVCARRPKRSSSSSSSSSPTTYSTIIYALRLSLARSPSSSTDPASDEPITHITASAGGAKERSVPVYIPRTQSRLGKIKLIPAAIRLCPRAEHLILAGGTQIYVASLQRTRAEGGGAGEGMLVDGARDEELIACPDGLAKFTTSNTLTALAVHPTEKSIATGDITGKIRIFHGLLEDDFLARRRSASDDAEDEANPSSKKEKEKEKKGSSSSSSSSSFFGAPSTLLHWHAHAVSTLAYLPLAATGARLLSGGEEATLVLWHVQSAGSGRVQKEFVPRLGAAIASVGLAGSSSSSSSSSGSEEEEIVCGLMDGSVIFLNPASLKVSRTFARLKVDASRALFSRAQRSRMPAPLALQPTSQGEPNLVLASGHPSTIQFYDPDEDGLVGELEVVGSNRVSRPDEAPIEPARVELVAFSPLLAAASSSSEVADWMATVDARRGGRGRFASEICLKFWMWDVEQGRYGLATSIDRPHGDEGVVSALSFGFLGPSSSSSSAVVGKEKKRRETTSFENLVCVSTGSDGKVKSWRPVRVLGAEGLGVAKAKKGGKKAKKAASEVTYHWVARSVFTFRQTVPHAVAWAPSPVPSSSTATNGGGLVAVAQGAFVTLWSLQPASNALVLALCAPELVSASASASTRSSSSSSSHEGGEQRLTEGAREVAFVGRAGRFVVGASKEVVVCWDLLSGGVVWTRSYASPPPPPPRRQQAGDEAASEKQHNSNNNKKSKKKSSRQQSNLRVARIIPVPPGSAEGAEEMFGVLLVDELKRCSRIEIFDLGSGSGNSGRTSSDGPTSGSGRVAAVGVLEIPFVVRSLVLAPAAHRSGSPGDGNKGKSQSSKNKKLTAAIGAMGGYALSADFEPVQLGFPVGGGGAAAAFAAQEGGEANAILRDGAEDVVRSRRVRTILDDLLGGGQAFLPEQLDALSLSNNKRSLLLLPGKAGAGTGPKNQMEDVFKLFEGPAHLLPPMSALFEAFSDAILPRRAVVRPAAGVKTAAADEDGDGDESD